MKNCDDIRGRLTLYLDNELQGDERAAVEAHLAECESCAAIFERELGFLNAIRESAPLQVAPPELRAQVEKILNGEFPPLRAVPNRPRDRGRVSAGAWQSPLGC